jgi:hypothetical protein
MESWDVTYRHICHGDPLEDLEAGLLEDPAYLADAIIRQGQLVPL